MEKLESLAKYKGRFRNASELDKFLTREELILTRDYEGHKKGDVCKVNLAFSSSYYFRIQLPVSFDGGETSVGVPYDHLAIRKKTIH